MATFKNSLEQLLARKIIIYRKYSNEYRLWQGSDFDFETYISTAKEEIKEFLQVGDARLLPFEDNSYDVVISINTVHNLDEQDCAKALQEIERVSKGKSFITVDAYRNNEEKDRMLKWNLTAKTIKHTDEWISFFQEVGYSGDYYWFIP